MSPTTLTIPSRFNGPPTSGHGGYSSGTIAACLKHDGPVAVSLRAPPPLDTPLTVSDGEVTAVHDGETLVATLQPASITLAPPGAVAIEDAAAAALDGEALLVDHPFPTCFGCGPARAAGDGLRLFAGPTGDGVFACTWTAHDADDVWVWSALDCPSGAPAGAGASGEAIVLARYVVEIEEPVRPGETYAIVSRLHSSEGRKSTTSVALYDAAGRRHARGESLWITLAR